MPEIEARQLHAGGLAYNARLGIDRARNWPEEAVPRWLPWPVRPAMVVGHRIPLEWRAGQRASRFSIARPTSSRWILAPTSRASSRRAGPWKPPGRAGSGGPASCAVQDFAFVDHDEGVVALTRAVVALRAGADARDSCGRTRTQRAAGRLTVSLARPPREFAVRYGLDGVRRFTLTVHEPARPLMTSAPDALRSQPSPRGCTGRPAAFHAS